MLCFSLSGSKDKPSAFPVADSGATLLPALAFDVQLNVIERLVALGPISPKSMGLV